VELCLHSLTCPRGIMPNYKLSQQLRYIALTDRMIDELAKEDGLRKTTQPGVNSWCPGRDSNLGPPE
jgi:hypothetical protein